MALARRLEEGVDVWVNTPRRPWEASGTSGMKVLVNGALNLSVLDGRWAKPTLPKWGGRSAMGTYTATIRNGTAAMPKRFMRFWKTKSSPSSISATRRGFRAPGSHASGEKHGLVTPEFSATGRSASTQRAIYSRRNRVCPSRLR